MTAILMALGGMAMGAGLSWVVLSVVGCGAAPSHARNLASVTARSLLNEAELALLRGDAERSRHLRHHATVIMRDLGLTP